MRSNPFATSFGKKTEERRGDPASPQAGYGRFARVQEASRAMPPRDGSRVALASRRGPGNRIP